MLYSSVVSPTRTKNEIIFFFFNLKKQETMFDFKNKKTSEYQVYTLKERFYFVCIYNWTGNGAAYRL